MYGKRYFKFLIDDNIYYIKIQCFLDYIKMKYLQNSIYLVRSKLLLLTVELQ